MVSITVSIVSFLVCSMFDSLCQQFATRCYKYIWTHMNTTSINNIHIYVYIYIIFILFKSIHFEVCKSIHFSHWCRPLWPTLRSRPFDAALATPGNGAPGGKASPGWRTRGAQYLPWHGNLSQVHVSRDKHVGVSIWWSWTFKWSACWCCRCFAKSIVDDLPCGADHCEKLVRKKPAKAGVRSKHFWRWYLIGTNVNKYQISTHINTSFETVCRYDICQSDTFGWRKTKASGLCKARVWTTYALPECNQIPWKHMLIL